MTRVMGFPRIGGNVILSAYRCTKAVHDVTFRVRHAALQSTKKGYHMAAFSRVFAALGALLAATAAAAASPMIGPVPVDFILFAAVLVGVAVFNEHSLRVSLIGVVVIWFYKIFIAGFAATGGGLSGHIGHLGHEWVLLTNLFFC